jgi:hypothetical protein
VSNYNVQVQVHVQVYITCPRLAEPLWGKFVTSTTVPGPCGTLWAVNKRHKHYTVISVEKIQAHNVPQSPETKRNLSTEVRYRTY